MAWSAEKDLEQSRMTEAKRTEGGESARMPLYLLALLGLAGCVAEPPVTTTTTTTTTRETVTTGPARGVGRQVVVTEAPSAG